MNARMFLRFAGVDTTTRYSALARYDEYPSFHHEGRVPEADRRYFGVGLSGKGFDDFGEALWAGPFAGADGAPLAWAL
jgi:hypothetical protein